MLARALWGHRASLAGLNHLRRVLPAAAAAAVVTQRTQRQSAEHMLKVCSLSAALQSKVKVLPCHCHMQAPIRPAMAPCLSPVQAAPGSVACRQLL